MEEEINIIESINFAIKKRKIIFASVLIAVLISLSGFFNSLKENKGQIVLKIGSYCSRQGDSVKPIASLPEIGLEINNGLYGSYGNIKIIYSEDSYLLTIAISGNKSAEELKKELQAIGSGIAQKHGELQNAMIQAAEKRIGKIEQIARERNTQDKDSAILQLEIINLKEYEESFSPTKIIKEPSVEKKNYNSIFFHLFIGVALGLILGIFIIYSLDWWSKNKGKFITKND